MTFRWDWLSAVLTAPYVPALGPVQPAALSAALFDGIVSVAGTGEFLPYDKDRRWSATKDEHILAAQIVHAPGVTIIPTLSRRGAGSIRLYYYAHRNPDLRDLAARARELRAACGARESQAIWLSDRPAGARTRLMLKIFGDNDRCPPDRQVSELAHCPAAATFRAFAAQSGEPGFAFLCQRLQAGLDDGTILVATEDQRIVGAVGPLTVLADATGTAMVPPAYYCVPPGYRRRGHGRALWRASMAWGAEHGAVCKVLQAETGSAAEQLYKAEGLRTLGFVCRQTLS